MKRILISCTFIILAIVIAPTSIKAKDSNNLNLNSRISTIESAKSNSLIIRLHEINSMDRTHLNTNDKRKLRKEVREISKQLHEMDGGIYLSIGAVILIVILLILLL